MELSGKIVAHVGGFGGIGLETSKSLLQKNIKHLIILDKEENPAALAELTALAGSCLVQFYKFDASMEKSAMQKLFDRLLNDVKYIDIFIYCAGILNELNYDLTFQINLIGYVNCLTILMPHMDKRSGGCGGMIVSVASVAGLDPIPYHPIYSACKSGMISIARSLSSNVVYDQTHISFVVICPGLTITPILKKSHSFLDLKTDTGSIVDKILGQSAAVCGQNLVAAIEHGENGAIWMLDVGEMKQIKLPPQWKPKSLQ